MSKLRINELESLETGRSLKVDEMAQTFDYEAGIKITSYSQMVRDDIGEFWRVSGQVALPYVTTGSGLPEGDALVPAGGAALVVVDSIADLQALTTSDTTEGWAATVAGSIFVFTRLDVSAEVSNDPSAVFYAPPASEPSGSSGAWVRRSGVAISNEFPQSAPEYSRLLSTIDSKEYVWVDGMWRYVGDALESQVNSHIQTRDAHGLREENVEIGANAVAVGTRSVAVGYGNYANGSYAFGRENDNGDSAFSVTMGSKCAIVGAGLRNILVGDSHSLSSTGDTSVIGGFNTVSDSSSSFIFGRSLDVSSINNGILIGSPNVPSENSDPSTNCIVIGNSARTKGGTALDPCEGSIAIGPASRVLNGAKYAMAIGRASQALHDYSTAIGISSVTTKENQVVIGVASTEVSVPGDFVVAGTKNFAIPHPVPEKSETHTLYHASYEGPVPGGTIYRYSVTTVEGSAFVNLPDYFTHLNKDVQVFVSPKGHFGSGYGEVSGNELMITSNSDGDYEVLILATRNDAGVQNWRGVEVENGND